LVKRAQDAYDSGPGSIRDALTAAGVPDLLALAAEAQILQRDVKHSGDGSLLELPYWSSWVDFDAALDELRSALAEDTEVPVEPHPMCKNCGRPIHRSTREACKAGWDHGRYWGDPDNWQGVRCPGRLTGAEFAVPVEPEEAEK
jgi:hypothetical protein